MIDRQTIERIKDAADIVDVVSEFVSLRRVGSNYRGLCPFHDDHTPSFYVSPSRRTCHCFVCGEGGDSVGFIMRHEQLSYPDALRWLASRYHIEIQEQELSDEQRKEQSDREAMYIVNKWAADYFKDILENDIDGRAVGMQYFRQRGIRDDIIERFHLGFALNERQALSNAALAKGYKAEYLLKTGLVYKRDNGELADRFAGRAIFPWFNVSGKVVAFGGRVLDSRTKGVAQKYVNSPDSDIYHKERELYGIFQAKKAIARQDCVYMVEGYTDVLSMHQCGLENVVANSGTALSEHQIHLLHRFTPNIVLLYDGDTAGINAALRGTDMLLKEGMNVKVLLLPDGDDPDSFARKHTAEEFRTYISEHQTDFIEFKMRVSLDGVSDPVKRSEAISGIVKSVAVIGDPIIRATYIQMCAMRLGIQEQVLTAKMNEEIRQYREEQRREEERRRRYDSLPRQDYHSTGQQPVTADGANNAPVTSSPPAGQNGDMPPYDAFLPDEAFSKPAQTTPTEQQTQSQPTSQQSQRQSGTEQIAVAGRAIQPVRATQTVEDMLLRMVVKYGERIVFDNVEAEDGSMMKLTLAEYVDLDLSTDNLVFATPVYNQVLDEAVRHCHDEDQTVENYLTMHPDYDISRTAIKLTEDPVMLTKRLEINPSDDMLHDQVVHLILDFRKEYVTNKLRQLREEIGMAAGDSDKQLALMAQMAEVQKVRNEIAKRNGASLVPR